VAPFTAPITKPAWCKHFRPGFSSYDEEPELVVTGLRILVEFASQVLRDLGVPQSRWRTFPFYVKATAGMRVIAHLPLRDRIMNSVRDYLANPATCPFLFERSYARVISGEEEGAYAFLSINFLSNTLLNTPIATKYGALDMGGSSTQITYAPPHDVLANYFPVRLHEEKIRLDTHSFLFMGYNEALVRVHDVIVTGVLQGEPNALMPPDAVALAHKQQRQKSERAAHRNVNPCFPRHYEYDAVVNGKTHHFVGTSDYTACSAYLYALLRKDAQCWTNTCSFAGQYQPRFENTAFVAFSGYHRMIVRNLGMPWDVSLMTLRRSVETFCRLDWPAQQRRYANASANWCFQAGWIATLLHDGYGFDDLGTRILFMDSINGVQLDWTLGSMLYEVNAMPFEIDQPQCTPSQPGALFPSSGSGNLFPGLLGAQEEEAFADAAATTTASTPRVVAMRESSHGVVLGHLRRRVDQLSLAVIVLASALAVVLLGVVVYANRVRSQQLRLSPPPPLSQYGSL
jgi:apyrase